MDNSPAKRKKGLPADLERETYEALKPIFEKYLGMKKSHMSKDRIAGVMYCAYLDAIKK